MGFDLQWLLIGLPVAFALGWAASRIDLRQLRRDDRDAPRAYFKGLTLLLKDQQDLAIDAFIEAVQHDPDTTELQFGLGNLFRRRGDFERAVRVHEHLLGRAGLSRSERDRAQHALAQDFVKAGLFDRAEAAYQALRGTAFDHDAQLALLALHERARDWPAAMVVARELERRGSGSFSQRIAHHACELALEADTRQQSEAAEDWLRQAREAAPLAVRPALLTGQRQARADDHAAALQTWDELLLRQGAAWPLVAADYARSAARCGLGATAREHLATAYAAEADIDVMHARITLEDEDTARHSLAQEHLQHRPGLGSAALALQVPVVQWDEQTPVRLLDVVAAAAKPLQRYRCAACGFEAHQYFWQCPGCQGWDTMPPRRLERT
jgi:lipopolysaccharide biosynthesis regulator YciM